MEDAPQLLKLPEPERPDIWIRLPRHKWPKSWSSMEDPVVPLERNLYGHPLAGLMGKAILSVYVDDISMGGNIATRTEEIDDQVYLGCT